MTIEKAKCGGYVAHYRGVHVWGRTRIEVISEMIAARLYA